MRKVLTPKKIVHYAIVASVVWISYRFYVSYQTEDKSGHQKPYGPRDIRMRVDKNDLDPDDPRPIPQELDDALHVKKYQIDANRLQAKQHKDTRHQDNDVVENVVHDDVAKKVVRDDVIAVTKKPPPKRRKNAKEEDEEEEKVAKKPAPLVEEAEDVRRNSPGDARGKFEQARRRAEEINRKSHGEEEEDQGYKDHPEKASADEGGREGQRHPDRGKPAGRRKGGKEKPFKVGNEVDWAMEAELQKRRKSFLDQVAARAEHYDEEEYKDMHERDDHLAFVTMVTTKSSWLALLQFIYSVQYFYPNSQIGIYDLGLTDDKREELQKMCQVEVIPAFIGFWPEHLTDITHTRHWRPLIWQMGLSYFGHMVYVEPDRYISRQNLKSYIEHSRKSGITVVGKSLQYSPFVVTHPEMYHFLGVDTRKLQRAEMFDVTMLILHNTNRVRHEFLRHLVACTLEEYCIAPPGAQQECDHRMHPGSRQYAHCHRYELSAVNLLLLRWFNFQPENFLARDAVTAHYNGQDLTSRIKTCDKAPKEEI